MKKRILSLVLALTMTASALPLAANAATTDFSDVSDNAWYKTAVDYAVENDLFSGNGDGTFSPNGDMTRAMFVTVLSKIAGADVTTAADAGFTDVPDTWFTDFVNWAAGKGYIAGTGNNKFEPNTPITREQIAVILRNYMEAEDIKLDAAADVVDSFKDASKISSWAVDAVDKIRTLGLMSGDEKGNFNPTDDLTRAEAASVFMKFDQRLKGDTTEDTQKPEGGTPLPNGLVVYEEPVSVEEAMSNVSTAGSGPVQPGVSSEGLIPAGTKRPTGTAVVEQQVYVDMGIDNPGILTTENAGEEYDFLRNNTLELYLYPGDSVTLDARDFGADQEGQWSTTSDTITVETIDDYTVKVTTIKQGNAALGFYYTDGYHKGIHTAVYMDIYGRRPAENETASFTLDTKYDTTYYVAPMELGSDYANVWAVKKGETFSKETADLYTDSDVVDNIRIYPTAGSSVPSSVITPEGYVEPKYISQYFDVTTSEYDTVILSVGAYLTVSFWSINSAAENKTITVTVTDKATGLFQKMDITVKYAG